MKLVDFEERNVIFAENQPEYLPLPAYLSEDKTVVTCCWELDDSEIEELIKTRRIWHSIVTFGGPLQPQLLSVIKPL